MISELWVWEMARWPAFTWDEAKIAKIVHPVDFARGEVTATGKQLDPDLSREALATILLDQAIASSAIEGEKVDREKLRKSLARRLEIPGAPARPLDRQSEGLADLMMQTINPTVFPITHNTLHGWHKALFPTGWSGMRKINVGSYRECKAEITDAKDGKVFYAAPGEEKVQAEMDAFIKWFNTPPEDIHPLIYSAIAHLWFVIIHPYEDGNGRISRALADLALTRQEGVRLYATAPIIESDDVEYYRALQNTNHNLDITSWIEKYVEFVGLAIKRTFETIDITLRVADFWNKYADKGLNERQIKAVKKLLAAGPEGYEGGMRNKKYCAITGCSNKTAASDLKNMMGLGIINSTGVGPSTAYHLNWGALKGWKS